MDHIALPVVSVLPTSGSCGQLLVYERPDSPGRSVAAAHDDQKKNAVSARRFLAARQQVVAHRVLIAQMLEPRIVAEQACVVLRDRLDRACALRRHGDRAARRIVAVAPHLVPHGGFDRRALVRGERVERAAVALLRQDVAQRDRFAVQPVGRPVGRDVAAMPPHGAELLAAHGAPRALAVLHLRPVEQHATVAGRDRLRNRRRGQVDLATEPPERGERQHEHDPQRLPELASRFHFLLLFDHGFEPASARRAGARA